MMMKIIAEVRIVSLSASRACAQLRRRMATPMSAAAKAPTAPTSVGVAIPLYKSTRTMMMSSRLDQILRQTHPALTPGRSHGLRGVARADGDPDQDAGRQEDAASTSPGITPAMSKAPMEVWVATP